MTHGTDYMSASLPDTTEPSDAAKAAVRRLAIEAGVDDAEASVFLQMMGLR